MLQISHDTSILLLEVSSVVVSIELLGVTSEDEIT